MPTVAFSIDRRRCGLHRLVMSFGLGLLATCVMNPVSQGQDLPSPAETLAEASGVVDGEANPADVAGEARRLVEALGIG